MTANPTPWDASMPLRAEASHEDIRSRIYRLCLDRGWDDAAALAAREYAEAVNAGLRAEYTRLYAAHKKLLARRAMENQIDPNWNVDDALRAAQTPEITEAMVARASFALMENEAPDYHTRARAALTAALHGEGR